jgi:hypothetical protein
MEVLTVAALFAFAAIFAAAYYLGRLDALNERLEAEANRNRQALADSWHWPSRQD